MGRSSTRKHRCTSGSEPSIEGRVASRKRQRIDIKSSSELKNRHNAKPSYFSLPAEIRNQITTLALTGGHIFMEARSYRMRLRTDDRTALNGPSAPAANFLATCRQAYAEGHVMFYTQNIFHLPVGSLEETKDVLAKIKPEHVAMMRNVMLGLTLLDITPTVALKVEANFSAMCKAYSRAVKRPIPRRPSIFYTAIYGHSAISEASIRCVLQTCWEEKLHFARSAFLGLEELRVGVDLVSGVMNLRGQTENGVIGHHSGCPLSSLTDYTYPPYAIYKDYSRQGVYEHYIVLLLHNIANEVAESVEPKISGLGWREFKKTARLESIKKERVEKLKLDSQEEFLRDWGMQPMSEEERGGL